MREIDSIQFKFERQKEEFSMIIDSQIIEQNCQKFYVFIMDLEWKKSQDWFEVNFMTKIEFKEDYVLSVSNEIFEKISNTKLNNLTDSFFAYAENKNQVVETKNVVLNLKKTNSFSNAKKCNLICKKNIFKIGSAIKRVGPFFDYIKRYIITIKSYFYYFIERKYKCRIFAT